MNPISKLASGFLLLISSLLFAAPEVDKAQQLAREGRYKEAVQIYQRERRLKKNDSLYALELFHLYVNLRRVKEAKDELKKIPSAQRAPLAKFCEEKGLANLAKEIYQDLEKSGIRHPLSLEEVYYNQARVYLKEGKIKEAIKKIASLPQESERKLYYRAKFFFFLGEFDSTLKYTFEFSRRFPKSDLRNSLYELNLLLTTVDDIKPLTRVYLLREIGENKKAEDELKKINQPYAKILLAKIYEEDKKTSFAIKLLEEVISKDTTGFFASKALLELAKVYGSLSDEGKAQTCLEELITRYSSSPFAPIARSLMKSEKRGRIH